MTTVQEEELVEQHAGCIIGCGWDGPDDPTHPEWCERAVGGHADAVTEPRWVPTQFWTAVIRPHLRGTFSRSYSERSDRNRDGVRLTVNVASQDVTFSEDAGGPWRELGFNLTAGEARQLAAQLVAAADSHDSVNQDDLIMRRRRHLGGVAMMTTIESSFPGVLPAAGGSGVAIYPHGCLVRGENVFRHRGVPDVEDVDLGTIDAVVFHTMVTVKAYDVEGQLIRWVSEDGEVGVTRSASMVSMRQPGYAMPQRSPSPHWRDLPSSPTNSGTNGRSSPASMAMESNGRSTD
jgi:hypothetical protein